MFHVPEWPVTFVARADVLREFLEWARGPTGPEPRVAHALWVRIARLLDDATRTRVPAGKRAEASVVGLPGRHPPLDARLVGMVLGQTGLRHAPTRSVEPGIDGGTETAYALPNWLTADVADGCRDPGGRTKSAPGFLRVRLWEDGRRIAVGNGSVDTLVDHSVLRVVKLRRKAPSPHRRGRLATTASALLEELEAILGVPASNVGWLRRMLDDPGGVESEALRIWNDFVARCQVPRSFRVRSGSLSLADLLVLQRGGEGGRHRQVFAEHHPWATKCLLESADPDEAFSPIDENPANSIVVAAEFFCCSSNSACPKAVRFAKLLPRHRLEESLDRLFGDPRDRSSSASQQCRALLLEAHSQDSELLTHIGGNARRTRAQIERARAVFFAYRDGTMGSFDCAYALATLLIRMMVRNAFDPAELDPESLVAGLVAASADTLAALASQRLETPSVSIPEPGADLVDTGVLALLAYVGGPGRPRLTMKQLVRFADAVRDQCVHRFEAVKLSVDANLPTPPGWSDEAHSPLGGVRVRALTSLDEMAREGREMKNCLRDGRYQHATLLGRLALFSIEANDGRATLALKPLAARAPGDGIRYVGWEIEELRGPQNNDPSAACERAASALREVLEEECPYVLPRLEVRRRKRVREALDQSRSFNGNVAAAMARWREVYVKHLPRSFDKVTPEEIVASYLVDPNESGAGM